MNQPENSGGVDKVLRNLDEQHAKYKHMELSLATKRRRLRQQIPDLARSLEMIEKLKIQKEEVETQFLLSDQVFVKVRHIFYVLNFIIQEIVISNSFFFVIRFTEHNHYN